ncbi:MAG: hypothetical protein JWQ09_266 [Segetibacter sp.]|nr:hypothetical protein [Segetibacter sp.]
MHEFEKALMNDPFLADALEGFSASDAALAAEHLAAIERSLTNDQQKAKVVYLSVQKTAWWKVAAIILVVISAGALTYSVLNSSSSGKKQEQIAASTSKTITPEKDSIGPVEKPLAKTEVLPNRQLLRDQNKTSPIIRPDANEPLAYQKQKQVNEAGNKLADKIEGNAPLMASSAPAPTMQNNEVASAQQMKLPNTIAQNEFKGKVVDKSGEPVPFANIKANNSSIGTLSDGNGNFSLKAPDSSLEVKINSPGYVSTLTKIKSNKPDNKITLKQDELSLSEIVVTGLAKKKKSTLASVNVDSSIAAEPVGGWKSFKQYLNQQLDSLKATEVDQDFNEDIVLEFSIDKKGQPTNIKAPAEIDKLMAEKAIQILSNGPRWKNKKRDKKVKVIISF